MHLPSRACVLGLAVMVLTLAGCGDEGSEDPTPARDSGGSEPVTDGPGADWPVCDEVWAAGNDLPTRYRGCLEGSTPVKADKVMCSSGQTLVTYDGRFYAVTGGPVNETESLENDADYAAARQSCLA